MGLLDCVASPEGRDKFDESDRPFPKPGALSQSDHNISKRRGLPLFASQSNLKNIRDVDFWRTRVLRFLYSPEGREDIRVLKIPLKQLGYTSITDFIADIPQEIFSEYLNQVPPDIGIVKEDKVFWVRDGIAEPGMFKWQGIIDNQSIVGLQLDRKKAVPYGIHDGKGLFYCKPGHRALVPEFEIITYKKFLRSFLGLPPRQDSLVGIRDSVRYSAKAIAAKNKKPGERVYLPKEKKWATVQWIGKIENVTVVDLIYDPPKPEAGKPVSPDEPCVSRSISLADFIGELNSEPNTPVSIQPQQKQPTTPTKTNDYSQQHILPEHPTTPLPDSSDESVHSSDDDSTEDETGSDEDEDDSASEEEGSESDASEQEPVGEQKNLESENKMETSSITKIHVLPNDENESFEVFKAQHEPSPKLSSPKRKGFFKFSPNKKQKRPKSTTDLVAEEKSEFVSMPELQHKSTISQRSRNSNLFASWGFKKNPKLATKPTKEEKPEKEKTPQPPPRKKQGLSSSWGALFKPKSKTQLQKLAFDDNVSPEECSTPIDEMIPPDNIPTPPPFQEHSQYNERRVDRPEFLNLPTPPPPPPETAEVGGDASNDTDKLRGDVSLGPESQSSEDNTSESDEEEGQIETQQISVDIDMHVPPPLPKTPIPDDDSDEVEVEEIKPIIPAVEKEVGHEDRIEAKANEENQHDQAVDDDKEEVESPPYIPTRSLERFKETRVRNRPSSFGSFLARIKNLKPSDDDGTPSIPIRPVSPPPVSKKEEVNHEQETEQAKIMPDENKNQDRKISLQSETSHSSSDVSDGKTNGQKLVDSELQARESVVRPQTGIQDQTATENVGNQEEIVLELLDVKEPSPPVNSPPPVPSTDPPRRRPSRNKSFTFSFSKKRKPSQPQTPTPREDQQSSVEDASNNDNTENIDPTREPEHKQKENEDKEKKLKTNSFRNSFRRTFSLTRSKKRSSLEGDSEAPSTPPTPKSRISKPRPVTMYIDNNEVAQNQSRSNSFRNKRPSSLVVDIKPWNMRHGRDRVDIYSSPSSDEAGKSPGKSPNPALLPKGNEGFIPKHRIFTTPAFFYKRQSSKGDSEPLVPKTKKSNKESISQHSSPETSPIQEKSPVLPQSPPPLDRTSEAPLEGPGGKLKSALKQKKEIDYIPKGLKVNDRVLWYSGKGPVPGTIQRLFKDGTDKYTAMVKFDREMQDEPLRLTREGDAYIVTVEELITPDMFEPTYANQSEIDKMKASNASEPITPGTPSVRFNELSEDPVPSVFVTREEEIMEEEEHDLPPPFQQEEVTMACGFKRGIQCRDKSCCLETILFSMFYTTNAFDITMLYANSTSEDMLTRKVRGILRKEIVDPLRREGFCPWVAVKKLRDAVKPLSDEWQTMSTDAEVMMFILFDRALKLQKFISYSNEMSDFLHQLVVDTKDLSKSTTVQHLFETSLKMMDKIKLTTVPTPALILEMPRSNDKLMQYKAVIPNLSLTVSHILDGGPRLCICGAVAKYDCKTCTANVGSMSIVYCENCKNTADVIHFQLNHDAQLNPLNQPLVILDLSSILCIKGGHYFSFVKCGNEPFSPWVFFDGVELENPKVCIEQNLSMWLDRLEKYPGRYQDALQYPLLTHILQDSHICIYQPREKSSSV